MLTVAAHPLRLRIVAELAGADGCTGHYRHWPVGCWFAGPIG